MRKAKKKEISKSNGIKHHGYSKLQQHVQDIDMRVTLFLNHSMRTTSISSFLNDIVHQRIFEVYFKVTSSIRPFLYGFFFFYPTSILADILI